MIAKSELRKQFFELLFKDYEGFICFATSEAAAPKVTFRQHFFKWPTDHTRVEEFLLHHEQRYNLYFCINLLSKMERRKEFCLESDIVWADLDEKNPEEIEDIPPQIVIQSSPGRWQAFWRLSSRIPPYEAEEYSRRVAYKYKADSSGWDLTQLFRVPFTRNLKYTDKPHITVARAFSAEAPAKLFELLPTTIHKNQDGSEMPDASKDPTSIIEKHKPLLRQTAFEALFTQELELDADWSKTLWRLIHECFKVGMTAEEVFTVVRHASCNKYERDGRPVEHLWREVIKASKSYVGGEPLPEMLVMPQLVSDPQTETFVDEYMDWACRATDAPRIFHELCAFIALSAIVSCSVRLETNAGPIVPNLWALILGESTISRKTTSMRLIVDILQTLDKELVVATDGTAEGILTGLTNRPNRTSIFWKDEVSGFFEAMNRRDYMSGMQETLAALYDVPPWFKRTLRKETFIIESPAFIVLAGGVVDRVYESVTEGYVLSGFLPRFLVVTGEAEERRPMGPPTEEGMNKKAKIVAKLADMYEHYASDVTMKIAGQKVQMPPRIRAQLTKEAWARNTEIENTMIEAAKDSLVRNLALPTFERMHRSLLKMGVILAASRQVPIDDRIEVEDQDIVNAAHYVQIWGNCSIQLIMNAGKKQSEKLLDKLHRSIENHPGILRGQLMRHFKLSKREATEYLDTLEDRGMVRRETRGTGSAYWVT